jgi:3-oxoacyl-[acyl-carrier protein] reductase
MINKAKSPCESIVVFGGGSGIGLATATLASAAGCRVTIADRNPETAALSIVSSQACNFLVCDATVPSQVTQVLADAAKSYGRLDGVVTTIGGARVRTDLALDIEYWREEIEFNLTSAYIVSVAAAGMMLPMRHGSIVMTGSSFGDVPAPDRIAYAAAKSGVIALTKSLALATARAGIRVNCVAPGATDTQRLRRMTGSPEDFTKICDAAPQGRVATPQDCAEAVLFLLSERARSVTGQVIYVNNGSYMR